MEALNIDRKGLNYNDFILRSGFCKGLHTTRLLHTLIHSVHWHQDHHTAFGRRFNIPRLQAWFGEDGVPYSYSNNLLPTQTWCEPLLQLRESVQQYCEQDFNSVLLTYYRDGHDYVGWHADDEKELGPHPLIASLSLGATRRFCFRHRREQREGELPLHDGDLMIMQPSFQRNWLHSVQAEPHVRQARINLTFRQVYPR